MPAESDPIKATIAAMTPEVIAARHYLHQNPELSLHERQTAALVAERLRALGVEEVRTEVGGHGVVGTLRGAADGPTLALRADMDALPIQEESDLPYKSSNPGAMHACGHDGHTSTLLGTAAALAQMRERLRGSV